VRDEVVMREVSSSSSTLHMAVAVKRFFDGNSIQPTKAEMRVHVD